MVASPIKRHGGKGAFNGKLARWIISLMPERDGSWNRFVEPYFGSGAVLFNLDPEGLSEYANDIDGELTHFWSTLRQKELSDELIRALSTTPLGEVEFSYAKHASSIGGMNLHIISSGDAVSRAASFFVRNRQSRQALGKDFVTPTSRTRRGMNEQVSAWLSAVDGLPDAVERLRRVEVWNRPALDVIDKLDSEKTVFYLDPPYLSETRRNGGGEYGPHEMSERDHDLLLGKLGAMQGRFLLSGYRSEMYDSFSAACGWNRHEFEIVNNASSKPKKEKKVECVWTNY